MKSILVKFFMLFAVLAAAFATQYSVSINAGAILNPGDSVVSANGNYRMFVQNEGEIAIYDKASKSIWYTFTSGNGPSRLMMQTDGTLVIYRNSDNLATWFTNTAGSGANRATLEDDGSLSLFTADGSRVWTSFQTSMGPNSMLDVGHQLFSSNRQYKLIVQDEGNMAIYDANGNSVWYTLTTGNGASRLILLNDGNLVVYRNSDNVPTWFTQTQGSGANRLTLENNGILVLYDSNNNKVWSSMESSLKPGGILNPNNQLHSPDGNYRLVMQPEGQLVIYDVNSQPVWYTLTADSGMCRLILLDDGNLVLYRNSDDAPVWYTETAGSKAVRASLDNDGTLSLYTADGSKVWTSAQTTIGINELLDSNHQLHSQNKQYKLVMQTDGRMVIYHNDDPVSYSIPDNNGASRLTLQSDGNLVIFRNSDNGVVWESGTSGSGAVKAVLSDNGLLTLYTDTNFAVWTSASLAQV